MILAMLAHRHVELLENLDVGHVSLHSRLREGRLSAIPLDCRVKTVTNKHSCPYFVAAYDPIASKRRPQSISLLGPYSFEE